MGERTAISDWEELRLDETQNRKLAQELNTAVSGVPEYQAAVLERVKQRGGIPIGDFVTFSINGNWWRYSYDPSGPMWKAALQRCLPGENDDELITMESYRVSNLVLFTSNRDDTTHPKMSDVLHATTPETAVTKGRALIERLKLRELPAG